MAEIDLVESKSFKALMSGEFLNGSTTRAFLAEAMKETIGPGKIAHGHLVRGQAGWAPLAPSTVRKKGHRRVFVQTGRVQRAISTGVRDGKLTSWGSSADIYSTGFKPIRYSANGIYAQAKATRKEASLTIGFNGRYKHSAGFNRARKAIASELAGRKVTRIGDARKLVSVGQVERRLRSINADRASRGLKTIRKTAAMGSQGFRGRKHVLARGKDNLAYADIVQRGKFLGVSGTVKQALFGGVVKQFGGKQLVGAKGLSSLLRSGKYVSGHAVHGVARPLLPYRGADQSRLVGALNRSMENLAKAVNSK